MINITDMIKPEIIKVEYGCFRNHEIDFYFDGGFNQIPRINERYELINSKYGIYKNKYIGYCFIIEIDNKYYVASIKEIFKGC
jgi:hypothetical protein